MPKYPTYLIHFNKNHDPKNGQFAEGDGDGDGRTEYQDKLKKKNKYEYSDGSLTEKGKQRLMKSYAKAAIKAHKKNENLKNVKVEVDPDKWRREDAATAIGRGIKWVAMYGIGFITIPGKKPTYNTTQLPDKIYVGREEDAVKTWLDGSGIYYEYLDEGITYRPKK